MQEKKYSSCLPVCGLALKWPLYTVFDIVSTTLYKQVFGNLCWSDDEGYCGDDREDSERGVDSGDIITDDDCLYLRWKQLWTYVTNNFTTSSEFETEC